MSRAFSRGRISRRAVLRLGLLTGIAASAGVIWQYTRELGPGNWLRWMANGRYQALFGPTATVAVQRVAGYGAPVEEALPALLAPLSLSDLHGKRVVIKPNLIDYLPDRPTITHPSVLAATIRHVQALGAGEILVAEGSGFRRDGRQLIAESGYGPVLERFGVPFVDLNYDDLTRVPVREGFSKLRELFLPRTVVEADFFITLPKMKTHHWGVVTLAMKSLYGVVPGFRYGWPKNTLHIRGIPATIMELAQTVPPALAIIDGIIGMEGDGPLYGEPRSTGVLVAGRDLVAVDATSCRIMGIDPEKVPYLAFSAWAGLGRLDAGKIHVTGDSIESVRQRYSPAPFSP